MATTLPSSSLPPLYFSLSSRLKTFVSLNEECINEHLSQKSLAIQAAKKGKRQVSCSQVRNLFWKENGQKEEEEAVLFIGLLIESEYINTQQVYFTYCFIDKRVIIFSCCCCLAENRQEGSCKHCAALLSTLFIIQKGYSKVPPKGFKPSSQTLMNLKGSSHEKLEKF